MKAHGKALEKSSTVLHHTTALTLKHHWSLVNSFIQINLFNELCDILLSDCLIRGLFGTLGGLNYKLL